MDYRLIVAGVNVTVASAAALAYGLIGGVGQLAGAGVGGLVAGLTILMLGVSAPSRLGGLEYAYAILARLSTLILGDLDLAGARLHAARVEDGVVVYWSRSRLPPASIREGVGVAGGEAYIAVRVQPLLGPQDDPVEVLVDRLGLARNARVLPEDNLVAFEYIDPLRTKPHYQLLSPHTLASLQVTVERWFTEAVLKAVEEFEGGIRVVVEKQD